MRDKQEFGEREHVRIAWHKPGYICLVPDGPWIECLIIDVSNGGVCLDVYALPLPNTFGLSFDASRSVIRVCSIVWRRGKFVGARYLSAKDLRHLAPRIGAQHEPPTRKSVAPQPSLLSL